MTSRNSANGNLATDDWTWTKDYIWRDGLLLATRQIEPGTSTVSTYHYHLDHLGTPRLRVSRRHVLGVRCRAAEASIRPTRNIVATRLPPYAIARRRALRGSS